MGRMNRRTMLGTTTAVLGGVAAGGRNAFGQGKPKPAAAPAGSPESSAAGPNLAPPVVDTKCGKRRGLREGKTLSFLGIRYGEAERFGLPKAIAPWEGVKNAQV